MTEPKIADRNKSPVLRLEYETLATIDADKIGAIITEVGKSFAQFERRRKGYRLAVRAAGSGSFWIDFVVMAGIAVPMAATFQKEIIEYTGFLADIIAILSGNKEGKPSAQDKRVVKALNAPVASGQAIQLNVNTQGVENTVIINGDISVCIAQYDARETQRVAQSNIDKDSKAIEIFAQPQPTIALRHLDGHFGTVFLVEGEWYVRLQGGGGVMNPLDLSSDNITVKHNQAYELSGSWEGRRYRIWGAKPIG